MNDIANPYRFNEPVTDPTMLFGRQEAVDWLERQLDAGNRVVVISGTPLIGKSSLINNLSAFQTRPADHLILRLDTLLDQALAGGGPATSGQLPSLTNLLWAVIEQLTTELRLLRRIDDLNFDRKAQPTFVLRELLQLACQSSTTLTVYFDGLHLLLADDMTLMASFLTSLTPLLDDNPTLNIIFTINRDQLRRIRHPLLDRAPNYPLGPLATDASLNMITLPVKNVLRFDYGITRRISEVTSHHPYYLSLFCHILLSRQMYDGWVNQRDFDGVLGEILDSELKPFEQMWRDSDSTERTVLVAMADMRGTHGPTTHQELLRHVQDVDKNATQDGMIATLEILASRGVLVPMGNSSYRFHVELLRYWLQRQASLAQVARQADWNRTARRRPRPRSHSAAVRATVQRPKEPEQPRRRWPFVVALALLLCIVGTGLSGLLAIQVMGVSLVELIITPTPTLAALFTSDEPVTFADGEATVEPTPDETATPIPTPTFTPVPVQVRTLPSIAFTGRDVEQGWQIYTMHSDGSEITPLTGPEVDDTIPVWSPLTQQVVFVSQRDGNRELYLIDIDRGALINLTRHPADDWTPSWSPDGQQILFTSLRSGGWELYSLDLTCLSEPATCPDRIRQLTDDGLSNISPVMSPDGSRIVYTSRASGNWDIYLMDADGSNIRAVTDTPDNEIAPVWSPDGTQLVYEGNASGDIELYTIPASGGTPTNLTNYPLANDHGPVWSPDGQQILFYANREGSWDIFSLNLGTNEVKNLTQSEARDEQTPAWRP